MSETFWHIQIRKGTEATGNTEDSPSFTIEETTAIINSLNSTKGPGRDLIEVQMVKEAWPVMQHEFQTLFNNCLTQKVFPVQFKYAQIRALINGEDKELD